MFTEKLFSHYEDINWCIIFTCYLDWYHRVLGHVSYCWRMIMQTLYKHIKFNVLYIKKINNSHFWLFTYAYASLNVLWQQKYISFVDALNYIGKEHLSNKRRNLFIVQLSFLFWSRFGERVGIVCSLISMSLRKEMWSDFNPPMIRLSPALFG